jgi:hypothetical protein
VSQQKELALIKGNERFVFRYEPGYEENILDAFIDMANDRANEFDWFDAAVLSFQLSKHLVEEADHLLCPDRRPSRSKSEEPQNPWGYE